MDEERRLLKRPLVNIRFTSSLTPDDENMIAPALLSALAGILDLLPIAYVIRIDTSDAVVYQHSGPQGSLQTGTPAQTRSNLDRIISAT